MKEVRPNPLRFPVTMMRKDRAGKKKILSQNRVRVEPKSFFANERTFIQWVSAALFLVTIAVLLLEFGTDNKVMSIAMIYCSAFIIVYSMVVYYRRVQLLSTGQAYGYIDNVGPLLLGLSVFVAVIVLLCHLDRGSTNQGVAAGGGAAPPSFILQEQSKQCYRHSWELNPLEFQARDLFVDQERDVLLIPTGPELYALHKHHPHEEAAGTGTGTARVFVSIPGADVEAITYTPTGRIFAVQEMPHSNSDAQLLEFDWVFEGEGEGGEREEMVLAVVQTWTIHSKGTEGIAWVHEQSSGNEYLYIASDDANNANDNKSDRGEIHVYTIPRRSSAALTELKPARTLNQKLINFGLDDSKIGSLQFFEGLLYILHDNARVVRAWDMETGRQMFEFELPLVEGGYDKQWEGMSLERLFKKKNARSLRRQPQDYPSDSSLVLHLALNTPAQIWSLAVSQEAATGNIILPLCASPNR